MFEDENEVMKLIRAAFANDNVEDVERLVEENESVCDDDLSEVAFRIAVQQGCTKYVEAHYEDIELNDINYGECSSYLHETDDEDMIDLLITLGAYRSWDEYSDYKFAVETINDSVLAFNPDFQKEVFNKLISKMDITEKSVCKMLDENTAEDFDISEYIDCIDVYNLQELCDLFLVSVEDGRLKYDEFDWMDDSVSGCSLREIIETLGWSCSFEGDSWKLETNGVYFIE